MISSSRLESVGEEEAYERARERAEAIQGLYIHILVYVVINLCLFGINFFSRGDGGAWWFYWPLFGWGIGLLIHVLTVVAPVFSKQWVDRRTERIVSNRHG